MSAPTPGGELTRLLQLVQQGDAKATEQFTELVQADLRRLAARFLAGEGDAHTLQPSALLQEAWLHVTSDASPGRQAGAAGVARGRGHFMAIAARALRQILVEHARLRGRQKGGVEGQRVTVSDQLLGSSPQASLDQLLDLHKALDKLAGSYPRPAKVVELRAFGGLTGAEAAEALRISSATVGDDWTFAKQWLSRELRPR